MEGDERGEGKEGLSPWTPTPPPLSPTPRRPLCLPDSWTSSLRRSRCLGASTLLPVTAASRVGPDRSRAPRRLHRSPFLGSHSPSIPSTAGGLELSASPSRITGLDQLFHPPLRSNGGKQTETNSRGARFPVTSWDPLFLTPNPPRHSPKRAGRSPLQPRCSRAPVLLSGGFGRHRPSGRAARNFCLAAAAQCSDKFRGAPSQSSARSSNAIRHLVRRWPPVIRAPQSGQRVRPVPPLVPREQQVPPGATDESGFQR
ncbi:hypothetical protein NDU88_006737 [Pleurodeles waltl]|uniref:Uncharacterized protein n=1 Tax=Pleurodeles waltl TaxID=8319 RepID=A0AAV7N1A9_PLEWA|nr:hypothetical protein NDU88_006737 [Pleurodeles waltl]